MRKGTRHSGSRSKTPRSGRKSPVPGCFICNRRITLFRANYPNAVCSKCDDEAVNAQRKHPFHDSRDGGDNPVFIRGIMCWRRYRFGGFITMADPERLDSLELFYKRHEDKLMGRSPSKGVDTTTPTTNRKPG